MKTGMRNLLQGVKTQQFVFLVASTVATSTALWLIGSTVGNIADRWWLLLLPLPVILLGVHYYPALPAYARPVLNGIMIGILVIFSIVSMQEILKNLRVQPVFDFPIFWILGKAAVQGQNFYHREVLLEIARPYNFPPQFTNELNGMYPPPSILLFIPLGLFELMKAQIPWYIISMAALVLAIILLWKEYSLQQTATGLLLTAVLVVVSRSARLTVNLGQITFLVLLTIALFWQTRHRVWGGIWLAVAFLYKPFFGLMGLYLLLTRRWRSLGGIILAAVLLSSLALLVFGPTVFMGYFNFNVAKQPDSYYTMMADQSLLATILRVTHYKFDLISPMLQPLFLLAVAVFTVPTFWLIIKLDRTRPDYGPALTLAWAAIVFPHILDSYAVLLIPSILFIWKYREQVPGKIWSVLVVFMLLYGFMGFHASNYMIITLVLNWLTLVGLGVWFLKVKPSPNNTLGQSIGALPTSA
jgi:hypothetical protein